MFCSKCGRETVENAVFCAGCGASLTSVQPARKKTSMSLAAGILEIVAGGLVALVALFFLIMMVVAAGQEDGMPGVFVLFPIILAVTSTLAIVGGICALRRRKWAMALTGAIAVIWPASFLGIAAVILTVMAKDEFDR